MNDVECLAFPSPADFSPKNMEFDADDEDDEEEDNYSRKESSQRRADAAKTTRPFTALSPHFLRTVFLRLTIHNGKRRASGGVPDR